MNKITFEDLPSTRTPLNARNMNAIQTNAENAINAIDTLNVPVTNIKENDDLNDYTTAGVYYSGATTITNSLSHCPVRATGLKLIVEYTTGLSRITQTIKVNYGAIYTRINDGSWSEWKRIAFLNDFTPIQTTLTLNMDYFDSVDNNKVVKSGNVVTVFLRAHTKAAIPNGTAFATLPYKAIINPTIPLYSGGRYSLTDPVFSYLEADSKNWRIATTAADKWLQASFTYITSD